MLLYHVFHKFSVYACPIFLLPFHLIYAVFIGKKVPHALEPANN